MEGREYNVMDYINNGVTLPKTSLVDALLQQFNPDEISAFRGQLNGIDESACMLLSVSQALLQLSNPNN